MNGARPTNGWEVRAYVVERDGHGEQADGEATDDTTDEEGGIVVRTALHRAAPDRNDSSNLTDPLISK